MHSASSPVACFARTSLCASLQATPIASPTGYLRCEANGFACTLGSLHKRNACLYLDIVANQNLLLERVSSSATSPPKRSLLSRERREDVLKVEAPTETALSTSKSVEGVAASKWIPTRMPRGATGVEASSAKLIKLFLLLRVGEDLVGGLNI